MQQGSATPAPVSLTGYLKAASSLSPGVLPKASSGTELENSMLKQVSNKLAINHTNTPAAVLDVAGLGSIGATKIFEGYNDSYQSVIQITDQGRVLINNPSSYGNSKIAIRNPAGDEIGILIANPSGSSYISTNGGTFKITANEHFVLDAPYGFLRVPQQIRAEKFYTRLDGRFAFNIVEANAARNFSTVVFGLDAYQDTSQVQIFPQHADITRTLDVLNSVGNAGFYVETSGGVFDKNNDSPMFSTVNSNYFSVYKPIAFHDGSGGNEIQGNLLGKIVLKSYGGGVYYNDTFNGEYSYITYLRTFLNGDLCVGTDITDPSAAFQVNHTAKGMLAPRMSTSAFTAIGSKTEGLHAFSNDDHAPMWFDGSRTIGFRYDAGTGKFQGYDGNFWIDLN